MSRPPRLDGAAIALLAFPPIFWAGNAIVGRYAAGLVAPIVEQRDLIAREWKIIAALGVFGMGSYNALQYLALTTSTATNVTLIVASAPVFSLAIGALWFGQRITALAIVGACVSIVGVGIVLVHGDPSRLATLDFVPGDLFMLGAAATWALYTWLLRAKRPATLSPPALLFAQILLGSVFCIACALVERIGFGVPSHLDDHRAWLVLAYVGVLPSVVGYVLWDRGVSRVGATVPIYFANLAPVFAAIMSALLLHEWPQWYHGVGLVLILVGIALAR